MKKPVTKQMQKPEQVHQGDVLLTPVDDIPKGIKPSRTIILAHGEITGHKHEILDKGATFYPSLEHGPHIVGFLHTKKPVNLVHEDHEGITVYPGKYEVRNQCEIEVENEDQEVLRRVLD